MNRTANIYARIEPDVKQEAESFVQEQKELSKSLDSEEHNS